MAKITIFITIDTIPKMTNIVISMNITNQRYCFTQNTT